MRLQLFNKLNYLDFHTHKLSRANEANITEIVSLHLDKETAYNLYTIGKHPWFTDSELSNKEKQHLKTHLQNENCLALGEVGLDKLKGLSINAQKDILRSQLNIAEELNKPVIVHCVRAFDQLLQVKKEFPQLKKWCIHGYARHAKLAEQLIQQGFYISLMPVLQPTETYKTLLRSLPIEKLFLETDSMPNITIEQLYLQASKIIDISVDELKSQLMQNAENFFKNE